MEVAYEIYEITKELNQMLEQLPIDDNREEYINRIDKLLEKRGKAIDCLLGELNNEQEEILRKAINLQKEIDQSLKKLFNEVEKDFVKIGQKKKFQKKYNQQPILVNGMFLDKRK